MSAPTAPPRPTQLAHVLLRELICPGDVVIDATAGNGHDTLFLAECVGDSGRVLAFDVQQSAIDGSRQRLGDAGWSGRVDFLLKSHALLHEDAAPESVTAVMFNLGYLPGGEHGQTTKAAETLTAIESAAGVLKPGGVMTVICYPGHEAGAVESRAVEKHLSSLPEAGWKVARYQMIGTRNPAPCLWVVAKS